MLGLMAYFVILAVSLAALFGASWLVIILGALALSAISLFEHRHYHVRFAAVSMSDVFATFALSNVGVSCVSAVAAFILGSGTRLLVIA
ncbi:MAG: hypothetical protein C0511_06290 [Hyphomicrobium sp.]|nr:hypothetical protein [Hyphomicrobium sp.]